jgi:hypothetical protein
MAPRVCQQIQMGKGARRIAKTTTHSGFDRQREVMVTRSSRVGQEDPDLGPVLGTQPTGQPAHPTMPRAEHGAFGRERSVFRNRLVAAPLLVSGDIRQAATGIVMSS